MNTGAEKASRRARSFVSARQVAAHAGVSRSAVSRTFTPGASVSPSTRAKVIKAAEALGYHVNHLARGLARESSGIVCIVAAGMATPHQSALLEAITRRLQDAQMVAMVINTAPGGPPVERALRQTLNYRADATVVLSGTPAASLIDTCVANGQRVILLNRDEHIGGSSTVMADNAAACAEAVAMLARAGCRRAVVVSSNAGTPSIVERESGFLVHAGTVGIETRVMRLGPTSYATGAETARAALSGGIRPDSAFCVTDLLACGFMDVARHDFALRIPDDLCVVGFDDIEQAGWASYALTTFRQPIEEIAAHVVGLVVSGQAQGAGGATARFAAMPVWRRSVRPRP
jgi:DNA-binding LacI/PurR family transcriptional regulator